MDNTELLALLKLDLTISTFAYDQLLLGLIDRAKAAIEREGITLDLEETADCLLVVQYAAYLWRDRKNASPAMPRSLRYELNNRFTKEHAEG